MTPAEYRELRKRRAEGRAAIAPRRCAGCGIGATLPGTNLCGVCALAREILGKPGRDDAR